MSILPVGACETLSVVAAMNVNGDWMSLRERLAAPAAAFGSRMTSPEVVVIAGIAGSVPNFFALGSSGSVDARRRQVQDDVGQVDVQRVRR